MKGLGSLCGTMIHMGSLVALCTQIASKKEDLCLHPGVWRLYFECCLFCLWIFLVSYLYSLFLRKISKVQIHFASKVSCVDKPLSIENIITFMQTVLFSKYFLGVWEWVTLLRRLREYWEVAGVFIPRGITARSKCAEANLIRVSYYRAVWRGVFNFPGRWEGFRLKSYRMWMCSFCQLPLRANAMVKTWWLIWQIKMDQDGHIDTCVHTRHWKTNDSQIAKFIVVEIINLRALIIIT